MVAHKSIDSSKKQLLSKEVYDATKFVAQIGLPAAGTLYFSVANIWHLHNPEAVLGTIVAIDTFLGALLGISTKAYNASDAKYDGAVNVVETPDKKLYSLDLNSAPEDLDVKDQIVLKVNKPAAS